MARDRRVVMDSKKKKLLEQAIASVEMEGFAFSAKKKKLCQDILEGVVSYEKFLADCKKGKFPNYLN